jgi:NAD+ kinase
MNKVFGVYANVEKPAACGVLARLCAAADSAGVELIALGQTADLVPDWRSAKPSKATGLVEAVIVLGGDGTMLAAVRELGPEQLPLIGVNIGSLGFMTSLALERLE